MIDPRSHGGFSLLELIIGTALTSVVLGSLVSLLSSGQGTYEAQQAKVELRQEARVAIEHVALDIRVMGYGTRNVPEVLSQASASTLQFAADIDDGAPTAPCGVAFENAVNGGVERITYRRSVARLLRDVDCWDGTLWTRESTGQVVADNLPTTTPLFRYFDADGAELVTASTPLTSAQRGLVRSIAVALEMTDTTRKQLVGATHTHQQLSTQVQLRNLR